MQQSYAHLTRNGMLTYVAVTLVGIVSLLFGLYLIIIVGYHERAYIFLGLGTGCFIGGVAGVLETRERFKTALSYGLIALGMMGIAVGINYLFGRYGPPPSLSHAALVLGGSIVAILVGIVGAWIVQPQRDMAALSRVLMLGIIASVGIVAVTVGAIYTYVLDSPKHGYMLVGVGVICVVIGIVGGVLSQSKTLNTRDNRH